LAATSPVVAKQAKHKSSLVAKHTKHKSSAAVKHKKRKSSAVAKHTPAATPAVIPTTRTPTDTGDCIAVAQAFYEQAEALSRRTKQSIPGEFQRVISKLDEFCGEEDFEKARVSIDWMSTCLQNFTRDHQLSFCSRTKSYFCAIDPQSDGCLQNQSQAR
jgi:hypothetical protein